LVEKQFKFTTLQNGIISLKQDTRCCYNLFP